MKIGVLTGGGDCPGLNAVIRAVVRKAQSLDYDVIGIKQGWKGILEKNYEEMDLFSVSGILHRGGTILGSSRTNVFKIDNGVEIVKNNLKEMGVDALVAIGGEDTLGVANKLFKEGVNVVGVPKTIDNDLNATDYTFGFDTAVNIATEAIDRLHTTAESHNRVIVVEVMGRHAGWIAVHSGMAGGADSILIPEQKFKMSEVAADIKARHARGKSFSIIVVAEGAQLEDEAGQDHMILSSKEKDSFGHVQLGGIGNIVAEGIEKLTGYETRATVLGHIQRGGSPTAYDRVLGTRFGVHAVELIRDGKFGRMSALKGNKIVDAELEEAVGTLKTVDLDLYEVAKTFFG
ncbi:MAG: 6-phosphofructokinase [Melioribacteraceae bacterium]|nr:6-phosphofructokinase [Melioribacteraceae bacterium]MCF8265602.1 6-phosphofructokinase [Melioribacteraceae bacterium]MCF8413489.1 6-phosphofructokinase [Melioribacteraceae bacterium]MCF8431557.1 6-phosphofructokinase [Melioribacteraceae bacterium]